MSLLNELFGWQDMVGNYNERKVARDEVNGFVIDTVLVTDRSWKYETAIMHEDFNDDDWIIVQGYATLDDAVRGHKEWLDICTNSPILSLKDCYTDEVFERQKGEIKWLGNQKQS